MRGSIPALSEVKANPAGTASSLWEGQGCCWMWQRHPNRKVSERKESAVLSPAIKGVSENWICVCVFLKLHADPILAHLRVQPTKLLLVQLIPGSLWGTDPNISKQSHWSFVSQNKICDHFFQPVSHFSNGKSLSKDSNTIFHQCNNTHGCSSFN